MLLFLSACSAKTASSNPDASQPASSVSGNTSAVESPARDGATDNDTPEAPEGKITLVLGGIGIQNGQLASLVNDFNAESTKYTVVIEDYGANTQSRDQAKTVMMNPSNFVEKIGGRYLRGAIDYEHAQCNLNTPEFREILQSALDAGRYDGGYNPEKTVPQRIVDGDLICCYVELSSALEVSFDRYRCGQTLHYVGWPTPDGSNGLDIKLMTPLGVSASTACPEGCWEFLKYLVLHPWMEYSADGTPIYAPLLKDNLDVLKGLDVPYAEITTFDDVQVIVELANTCNTMDFYDTTALSVILEVLGELESGSIDLDTALGRMQSKLSLYLMEQYG